MQSDSSTSWPLPLVAATVAYAAAGWPALHLASAPGWASPLFPAAGIALVCVLVYGMAMLPGIALAAFAVALAARHGEPDLAMLGTSAIIALGATLQAAVGATLVKRFIAQPLSLTEPREVALFFVLGALLACLISASVAVLAFALTYGMPASQLPTTWWTWWSGDVLGVLVGAPITLALIGRPRSLWAARRRTVALPLALATGLAATAIVQVTRSEEQRVQAVFEHDAATARNAVASQLQVPLHALQAIHGLYFASQTVSATEFRKASRFWVETQSAAQTLGWSERVPRDRLAAFEAAVRSEGIGDYKVFDLGPGNTRVAPTGAEVMAVRHIEPQERNRAALGVNSLSIAPAREAMDNARRSGQPVASAGFRLTQESANQTGVVVYRAVYNDEPATAAERFAATRGVVFVAMRMDDALAMAMRQLPAYLALCIVDTGAAAEHRRLAGAAGCEQAPAATRRLSDTIEYAGRRWDVIVSAKEGELPGQAHRDPWLFSSLAIAAVATLSALLLTLTGRARRIEVAVGERTADLEREITERVRTEAALRESEQRFRNILNHVPIGVIYTDLQGFIKESNPKFRELVGYSAEELATMTSMEFAHPEERRENLELSGRLVRGEISVYRRQQRYITHDGAAVHTRSIVSLLRDAEGRPHRIVGVVEDITEHLKLQEAEAARELAEAANRAKSEFLSRMSHELRTPLNAMLGFAQLIELDRQQALSDSQRDWVAQIQTAGWHLLDMINDTLDLSRIESGTLRLDVETIDLAPLVTATTAMVERAAAARGIVVTEALDAEAAQIIGDSTRVKQILTNLLTNAVKYNIDGGRIHIATRLSGADAVELVVSDTGLGMNAQQLAALFQPFNRLGRERMVQEGTGIGLVISQRLAELMGGSLQARSTEGEGSSFILMLPGAVPEAAEPRELPEDEPEMRDYRQRVVHYIEDNETNAVVMEGILAQRPQVRLKVSTTGLEGLAAIRAQPPSLILLDMHLPDIEGLQLLRILKDDITTATIPVVVVSADAVSGRIRAAMDAGAERYLTKPVNVAELLRLVDDQLEQRDTLFG
jgi:PAS domain S-box-containing protein